ncbi:uncharacterized protein LOC124114875 isoform X1 [Haliotis rufescens]|uniref:uncharacterized protein LOC124114875 isoform X1 n=1 Tax=Haliotis rufescens TaxID=6454 RepID=UPI00201F251A|nr:uncharacterized protein LOC124114875 isoform X1 [Haliotis rufescens]XP_046331623.2 uncharacterized protein LOC124114875 isoform X1 [Haliotis rufescens]
MGKVHKKHASYVNLISTKEDEIRRQRESILADFRKHFQAAPDAVNRSEASTAGVTVVTHPPESVTLCYSSDASDSSMGSQDEILQRKRRRKTKAERNKTRSKSVSSKNDSDSKADVNKHLKTAHSISYPLRSKGLSQRDDSFNVITQGRLTKRLGLFNKSKKSETISRKPIVLTESTKKETEDDLKKILNIPHDDSSDVPIEVDVLTVSKRSPVMPSGHSAAVLYRPVASKKMTPVSTLLQGKSHTISSISTGISTCPNSMELDNFSKILPIHDIVQELSQKLQDHKIFRGINTVREICDDLNKQMKHNALRTVTPCSTRLRMCVLSSGGSVCRSLADSFTPQYIENPFTPHSVEKERDSKGPTWANQNRETSSLVYEKVDGSVQSQATIARHRHQAGHSSLQDILGGSHQVNQPPTSVRDLARLAQNTNLRSHSGMCASDSASMNAIDLLKHNDSMCLKREISCTIPNPNQIKQQPLTALNLLAQNDTFMESRNQDSFSSLSNKDKYDVVMADVLPDRDALSQNSNSQSSGFHSHSSEKIMPSRRHPIFEQLLKGLEPSHTEVPRHSPLDTIDSSVLENRCSHGEMHMAVVAEYREEPKYMPQFHGDFYKDSLWFEKTILSSIDQGSDRRLQADIMETDAHSMDILEYLDRGNQDSPSTFPHSSQSNRTDWSNTADPYALPKPMSPDSPQMFPRRLY